jgi:hypothetical protein
MPDVDVARGLARTAPIAGILLATRQRRVACRADELPSLIN